MKHFMLTNNYPIINHSDKIKEHHKSVNLLIRTPMINDQIIKAIKNGKIKSIISSKDCLKLYQNYNIELIEHEIPSLLWSQLCSQNYPLQPKNIILITGTNGKTSICSYIMQILTKMNQPNINFSSIGTFVNNKLINFNKNSTQEAEILHSQLNDFAKNSPNGFAIIETTSIGIDQHRIASIKADIAIWNNLSSDHLDYHGSQEEYFQAKMKLGKYARKFLIHNSIQQDKFASYGNELLSIESNNLKSKITYKIDEEIHEIETSLLGKINAENILSSIIALKHWFPVSLFKEHLSLLKPANGRLNIYKNVIIDYAHTKEAIENLFKTLKESVQFEKIIVVIGFGGNRDPQRQEQISAFLSQNADYIFITNDNPRNENPLKIALKTKKMCINNSEILLDRSEAIKKAIESYDEKNLILVIGKGHEETMEYENGRKEYFSDKEEVIKNLKTLDPQFKE